MSKELENMIRDSKNDKFIEMISLEKTVYECLLDGMILKLNGKKGEAVEKQLSLLKRMKRFQERQTYVNVNHVFQAKMLLEKERQILLLERELEEKETYIKNLLEHDKTNE